MTFSIHGNTYQLVTEASRGSSLVRNCKGNTSGSAPLTHKSRLSGSGCFFPLDLFLEVVGGEQVVVKDNQTGRFVAGILKGKSFQLSTRLLEQLKTCTKQQFTNKKRRGGTYIYTSTRLNRSPRGTRGLLGRNRPVTCWRVLSMVSMLKKQYM